MLDISEWREYDPSIGDKTFDCSLCGENEAEIYIRDVVSETEGLYNEYQIVCGSCGRKSGIHTNAPKTVRDWKQRNAH